MEVGKPERRFTIVPKENPVPQPHVEPATTPAPVPVTPELEPVEVPR